MSSQEEFKIGDFVVWDRPVHEGNHTIELRGKIVRLSEAQVMLEIRAIGGDVIRKWVRRFRVRKEEKA